MKKKRFWISWYQPTEDYRPLTDPPNKNVLAWWSSGMRDNAATLVALVQATTPFGAENVVLKDWPEAKEWRFTEEVAETWLPGDRFPVTKAWERERLGL